MRASDLVQAQLINDKARQQMYPLSEQIREVKREIGMRIGVYKKRMERGEMTQAQAEHQMGLMRAVLESLYRLQDLES